MFDLISLQTSVLYFIPQIQCPKLMLISWDIFLIRQLTDKTAKYRVRILMKTRNSSALIPNHKRLHAF